MRKMSTLVLKLLTLLLVLSIALCSCDSINSLLADISGAGSGVEDNLPADGSGDENPDDGKEPHSHSYTPTNTAPTCTEKGSITYNCECGHSFVTSGANALGHTYRDGVCSVCGNTDPDYQNPGSGQPGGNDPGDKKPDDSDGFDYSRVPEYTDSNFVAINNNVPYFTADEITPNFFESYSELDELGRVGVAFACLGTETLPTDSRGSISYNPTGWVQNSYPTSVVPQTQIYNRSHLIAWSLSGENNNSKNLMTGTPYFNQVGMQIFETQVLDYIKETGNHVMYRVTPVFVGNDLLARGVLMEGWSVEDNGDGICFCVFMYNVQPGVVLEYETGNNYQVKNDDDSSEKMSATLVTDLSQIKAGDKIIIVAKNADYAMGASSNNGNNRVVADVQKDGNIVYFDESTAIITIGNGTTAGTYSMSVSEGYLYAASSSSNHLKTQASLTANSSWTIEISASGVATIKSSGSYTRNWLRYNSQNVLFSAYGSGQQDVCIYIVND